MLKWHANLIRRIDMEEEKAIMEELTRDGTAFDDFFKTEDDEVF